jgi:hypothetical protein
LKVQVMTTPGSNSGIFFHTAYQETGWLTKAMRCRSTIRNRTGAERQLVCCAGCKRSVCERQ